MERPPCRRGNAFAFVPILRLIERTDLGLVFLAAGGDDRHPEAKCIVPPAVAAVSDVNGCAG